MKKLIVLICFIIFSVNQVSAQEVKSPDYIVEGNVYSNPNHHISSTGEVTEFTWQDSKGISYPIYITSNGSCYVIRISQKTGKEYKQYLKKEISQDICRRMNRQYKGKK